MNTYYFFCWIANRSVYECWFLNFSKLPIFLRSLSIEPSLILISWFLLLCETFTVSVYYWECVIVFASTWLGYSADRYFEPISKIGLLNHRHLIFKQVDKMFKICWLFTLVLTSAVSIYFLNNLQLFLLTLLFISTFICLFIAYQEAKLECNFIFIKEFRTAYILSLTTTFFMTSKISVYNYNYFISFIFFLFFYLNNLLYTNIYDLSYDKKLKRASSLQANEKVINFSIKLCFASILMIVPIFSIFQNIITTVACIIVLLTNYLLHKKNPKKGIQIDTIYWIVPLFFYFTLKVYNEI